MLLTVKLVHKGKNPASQGPAPGAGLRCRLVDYRIGKVPIDSSAVTAWGYAHSRNFKKMTT